MFSKFWIRVGFVIAIVGGIAALLAYSFSRDSRYVYSPLVAKRAPSFTLTLFDGGTLHSKDLIGKAVLVNFWASWCVPCRAEAPALEETWRKYRDKSIVFLGVNIQDKEEEAQAFVKEFGITYLNGRDSSGEIAIDYGIWGIPVTFFLDPHGRITYKHAGELRAPVITAKLDEALKGIVSVEEGKGKGKGKGEYRSIR